MASNEKTSVSELTENLARYISTGLDQEFPAHVVDKTRAQFLDTLAAMVSGSLLEPGRLATDYVRMLGGAEICTVVGSDFRTNPVNAALANGMMGHADESDDSHLGGRFHPGCGIVPAALAVAELISASGRDLLSSITIGYEIGIRFNLSLGLTKLYAGGHSTHSVGTLFGGTAATAALLRHDTTQVRHQLSYSVQQASGVQCWIRDARHVEKAFDFGGMSARNAVTAATMIRAGFTGVDDALSGPNTFYSAFGENPDPSILLRGLGSTFEILGTSIKKWCVGAPAQSVMDALVYLMAETPFRAEDIERIELQLPSDRVSIVDSRPMPAVNVQFLSAVMLLDRGLSFESAHDEERMKAPEVADLVSRMTLVGNEELTHALPPRQVIVTLLLKEGRKLSHRTRAVRGTPDNPMTYDEVVAKARDLFQQVLPASTADDIIAWVNEMEAHSDVSALSRLLRKP